MTQPDSHLLISYESYDTYVTYYMLHQGIVLDPDFGTEKQEFAGLGRKPPAESVTFRLV